jgi:hypothetical protein
VREILPILAALLWLAPAGAGAQETLDDLDKAKPAEPLEMGSKEGKATSEVNGYAANRLQYGHVHTGGLIPTEDIPSITELLEGNIQLKVSFGKDAFAYADLSVFFQTAGLYYTEDAAGRRVGVPDHDVASLHPLIVPAELYASFSPRPWLALLAGRKRITWGSAFAFNPTDLVNPPKDPTDPAFQRAGSWLARVEAPFEKLTMTVLFAPSVMRQVSGIPYRLLVHPEYPEAGQPAAGYQRPNGEAHFLTAARLYALVANADVNLIYYFSNRYRSDDDFRDKSRFGASFSRYFFDDWELHLEALLQLGSTRRFADSAVANGGLPSAATIDAVLPQRKLASNAFSPHVVLGTRHMFADESNLSVEYYYQADGYSSAELEDYVRLLARAKALGLAPSFGAPSSQGGLPQKFTFDPLRRHYLIAGYNKPKIRDDFAVGATLIAGLEDLSGTVSPMVSWNAREWLTLSAAAFVPFHDLPVGTVCAVARQADGSCPDGQSYGEYAIIPQDFRVLFEARAFY